jgi:TPR repeat protein
MRSFLLSIAFFVASLAATFAQGPPLNGTPEQLFDAGLNAISGSAGSRDYLAAIEYFRRSAQKDYGPAQVALGYFYDTGQIVAADPSQAADWYRKAAEQGDPLAQWLLGRLYFVGSGLSRDYSAAQKWLTPSAKQGNPFAAYLLGGVMLERDYKKAPHWFHVAAQQGLPQAQYRYARALKEGYGIERDRVEAYVWFLIALDAGYSPAQNDLGELDGMLSRDQIDQAKGKARKLEDSVTRSVTAHGCAGWDGEFAETPSPPPPRIQRFCR